MKNKNASPVAEQDPATALAAARARLNELTASTESRRGPFGLLPLETHLELNAAKIAVEEADQRLAPSEGAKTRINILRIERDELYRDVAMREGTAAANAAREADWAARHAESPANMEASRLAHIKAQKNATEAKAKAMQDEAEAGRMLLAETTR